MGELTFDVIDVDVLGPDAALVFGAWSLKRADDRPHGLFTLVFRNIDGRWVIVADHTSSAD
jgi:ketosteroid isomerase-like protein